MEKSDFAGLLASLAAAFGRKANGRLADEYYQFFRTLSPADFGKICHKAKLSVDLFPSIRKLLEIKGAVVKGPLISTHHERSYHFECKCGTSFIVGESDLVPMRVFKCDGSMAKGFKCERTFDSKTIRARGKPIY